MDSKMEDMKGMEDRDLSTSEKVIEMKNVSKSFRIYKDKGYLLKEKILQSHRNSYEMRTVLNDICFHAIRGETVGLIGDNGCGKSTLLKLLAGILYPESGNISIKGRVVALLELGVGFQPELTGRENIYMNASMYGIAREEIDRRIADIISFSELEEFIDVPVRLYSSGMYMRLGFSVAIHLDADILLIDEILAVGDLKFQKKCFHKLMEIREAGKTIILVSHSMEQIEKICDRCIWLQNGEIKEQGIPSEIIQDYMDCANGVDKIKVPTKQSDITISSVSIMNGEGMPQECFETEEDILVKLELYLGEKPDHYSFELNIIREDGTFCSGISTKEGDVRYGDLDGNIKLSVLFSEIKLLGGNYHFDLHIADREGHTILFAGNFAQFEIKNNREERGMVLLEYTWMEN